MSPSQSLQSKSPSPSTSSPSPGAVKKRNFDADDIMNFLKKFKEGVAKEIKAANETMTKDFKKANKENCEVIERRMMDNIEQVKNYVAMNNTKQAEVNCRLENKLIQLEE